MTAPSTAGLGLDLPSIARTILDGIVAHYADSAVTLPDRRVIAGGNPRLIAWDNCEQLVVSLSGVGVGSAPGEGGTPKSAGNQVSASALRHAVFAVQITRRNPESADGTRPPPADEQTAAALAFMRDAGLLSHALVRVCTTVAAALPRGPRVQAGAVECLGPEGGFVCSEGSIAVTAGMLA